MPTRKPVDATALISQHWPTIGPHIDETIASAAEAIGELYRYLAHATRSGKALPYIGDGYRTLGSLAAGASSAQQVAMQLGEWAARMVDVPDLRHDNSGNPAATAGTVVNELVSTAGAFGRDATALSRVQSALGHLYHDNGE